MGSRKHKYPYLPLWILLALFVTPFITGSVVYQYHDFFRIKSIPAGDLIHSAFNFEGVTDLNRHPIEKEVLLGKWLLVYIDPEVCDEHCVKNKHLLNNLHIALNKDQHRVKLVELKHQGVEGQYAPNSVLVVDTRGLAMMHFKPDIVVNDPRKILKDVRKLLKLSQIG